MKLDLSSHRYLGTQVREHIIVSTKDICDRLQENRAQRGVRKYREKIDRFLKNVLFQADGRERLGLL